jgi:hypothetical protein
VADADDLRRLALALDGASAAPHFDRTAFRARRIFATLAPDGATANLMLTPEQQALKCTVAPHAFAPVLNAWGEKGATSATLARLSVAELEEALRLAWTRAAAPRAASTGTRLRRTRHR